jgi:hypothetical protein
MGRLLAVAALCAIARLTIAQTSAATPSADTAKPLPPVAELLGAVEKHEDRDDALLQHYTYHRRVVMEDFDSKNGVKKTTITDYESIPIEGVRVSKLVARDGKPLTPDEARKADEEFDKAVEKARKNKAESDAKREQAEREGKSNREFLPASRVLQLGTFSNERRIDYNGRPTIVLDFAGNHNAKTQSETEKIVEDLVGTVWIDEQDRVLARVEGHFLADFKIGLGLVLDIHKGLTFTMEQQKINDEVWLTKQIDGFGKASVGVFVVRVNGHTHAEMSDYRKFRTSATIVGSNGVVGADDQPDPRPPGQTRPPRPRTHRPPEAQKGTAAAIPSCQADNQTRLHPPPHIT